MEHIFQAIVIVDLYGMAPLIKIPRYHATQVLQFCRIYKFRLKSKPIIHYAFSLLGLGLFSQRKYNKNSFIYLRKWREGSKPCEPEVKTNMT